MEDGKNIVLIGMPGVGKSTVGVLLAKTLGFSFEDTDLLIQRRENQTLQEIIEKKGVKRFLEIEAEIISRLNCKKTVIATGGSAVYSDIGIRHLKENGRVIYIRLDFPQLEKRITNMSTRGIAIDKGKTLLELYYERLPLYEKYADITVDSSIDSVEETLKRIIDRIKTDTRRINMEF